MKLAKMLHELDISGDVSSYPVRVERKTLRSLSWRREVSRDSFQVAWTSSLGTALSIRERECVSTECV